MRKGSPNDPERKNETMKKTIILQTGMDGRVVVLEQIMRGALASGWVVSKSALIFNSKKEAQETIKSHPCGKGCKAYTLNPKQAQALELLKNAEARLYIKIIDFLMIK